MKNHLKMRKYRLQERERKLMVKEIVLVTVSGGENGQQKNVELHQQQLRWRERKILKLIKMAVMGLSVIGRESWDK